MNHNHTLAASKAQSSAPRTVAPEKTIGRGKATAILLVGVLFLSFTAIWVKASNFEPATSAFLRVILGAAVLAPFAYWEVKKKGHLSREGIIFSVVAGLFLGVDFTAWNYSIFYVGAGVASILLNLQVIIVPMLIWAIDKYRVPKVFIILVPLMIIGIMLTGGVFDPPAETGPATIYGIKTAVLGTALGCTSGVCYSFYLYFTRKAGRKRRDLYVQPIFYVCIAQVLAPTIWAHTGSERGGFDFTHGVFVNGELPAVNPETTLGDPITTMNWVWMIMLIVLGQAAAWTFVQIGSVNMDPTLCAGLLLLSPVTTVLVSPIIVGERISNLQIIGVVIVLATVAYQNGVIQAVLAKLGLMKHPEAEVPEEVPEI